LLREYVSRIDSIFLTHWHFDHYGGLGELEYYVKLKRKAPIEMYVPPSAMACFEQAFPEFDDIFDVRPWEFNQPYTIDNLSITPLPAIHSIETAGFLVQSANRKLAYFPDTAGLSAETAMAVEGVDWFICDATFHGDNWFPQSHMNTEEAIELGRRVHACQTILTHMSIHYSQPVTSEDLQLLTSRCQNVLAAYDGMTLTL
jgi:phosphoribosyl 1,2-cyclic phosphate phosphodiesterase